MWTLHKRQQHCGAQLPARERGRQPGDYPASAIEHRHDKAPSAPDGSDWDEVVQPEQQQTELEQDERDDPAKRERGPGQDGDEGEAGRCEGRDG